MRMSDKVNDRPVWIRPHEVKQYFGFSRAYLYQLLETKKIKSVSIVGKGNVHGVRLIKFSAIEDYLKNLEDEQN